MGFYVIKDYEPKLSLVISKLLLWRVVHICNFIKNVLHHGRSPYNFVNYSEFLENLWAGLRYRAAAVRFHCVIHCVLSVLHFQNFENVENLLILTVYKPCNKFGNKVRSLEIWPKTNSLCQAEQDEVYSLPLVKNYVEIWWFWKITWKGPYTYL